MVTYLKSIALVFCMGIAMITLCVLILAVLIVARLKKKM